MLKFFKMAHVDDVAFRSSSAVVNGITTDVVCYGFANRTFIILTQLKRPGTFIHMEKQDAGQDVSVSQASIDVSMDVLLGVDDPVYRAYANKIAMEIFKDSKKPVLLAIALKDKTPSSLNEITELVVKNLNKI